MVHIGQEHCDPLLIRLTAMQRWLELGVGQVGRVITRVVFKAEWMPALVVRSICSIPPQYREGFAVAEEHGVAFVQRRVPQKLSVSQDLDLGSIAKPPDACSSSANDNIRSRFVFRYPVSIDIACGRSVLTLPKLVDAEDK